MHALRDVVIDETRWPRMFEKLRQAGFYRKCNCGHGCGCQLSAKRFLRGIALGAARELSTRAWRSPRLAAYARNVGRRRVRLLVDRTRQPVVVDVAVSIVPGEGEVWEYDVTLPKACAGTWKSIWEDGPPKQATRRNQQIAAAVAVTHPMHTGWCGPTGWAKFTSNVPADAKGLYLLRWPDGRSEGAYLGKSEKGSSTILMRLKSHYRCWRRFQLVATPGAPMPGQVAIYWRPIITDDLKDIEKAEDDVLTGILRVAGYDRKGKKRQDPSRSDERIRVYRRAGFGNLTELELNPDPPL